jgi:hypothetical protein
LFFPAIIIIIRVAFLFIHFLSQFIPFYPVSLILTDPPIAISCQTTQSDQFNATGNETEVAKDEEEEADVSTDLKDEAGKAFSRKFFAPR